MSEDCVIYDLMGWLKDICSHSQAVQNLSKCIDIKYDACGVCKITQLFTKSLKPCIRVITMTFKHKYFSQEYRAVRNSHAWKIRVD